MQIKRNTSERYFCSLFNIDQSLKESPEGSNFWHKTRSISEQEQITKGDPEGSSWFIGERIAIDVEEQNFGITS